MTEKNISELERFDFEGLMESKRLPIIMVTGRNAKPLLTEETNTTLSKIPIIRDFFLCMDFLKGGLQLPTDIQRKWNHNSKAILLAYLKLA